MIATAILFLPVHAYANSAEKIDARASEALDELYEDSTAAKELGTKAKAFLVFPKLTRAGWGIGKNIEGTTRNSTISFVFGDKGLMAWVSLDGSKFSKINKSL